MPRNCSNKQCYGLAKFMCSRCNCECYCSKQCQVAAFPEHRFTCFELPSLTDMESSFTPHFSSALQLEECKKIKGQKAIEPAKPPEVPPRNLPLPDAPHSPDQQSQPTEKSQEDEKSDQDTHNTSSTSYVGAAALLLKGLRGCPRSAAYEQPVEPVRIFLHDLNVQPLPATHFKANFLYANSGTKIFAMCELSALEYEIQLEQTKEFLEVEKSVSNLTDALKPIQSYHKSCFIRKSFNPNILPIPPAKHRYHV